MIEHPVFRRYRFMDPRAEGDVHIDCMGAKARAHYMPLSWFDFVSQPKQNEMLFEWIDLLDAVASGDEHVTVMDLGAGYGRWLVIAWLAAKQLGKRCHVVGVEAEPTHFAWMLEHFADNKLPPSDYTAVQAVVSDRARKVFFVTGHAKEWYGQSILDRPDSGYGDWHDAAVESRDAISISSLVGRYALIDALHMDIQGEERRVVPQLLKSASNIRRMHVETHLPEIDAELPSVFSGRGWLSRFQYPCDTKNVDTEFGPIDFQGGVQSWDNPAATRSSWRALLGGFANVIGRR